MKKFILLLKHLGLYYVSFVMIVFGFAKFTELQFGVNNFVEYTPLNELSNWQLAWAYFGRSYNYKLFLGIIELITGSLILFKRTRLTGLLLALGIYVNIVIIDFEFGVTALTHATVEFIIILILLLPYLKDLKKYLWDMGGKFANYETNKNKIFSIYLPAGFIISISFFSYLWLTNKKLHQDKIFGAYKISELSVNSEKLELGQGKYTKKPMLYFEFRNGFILTANDSSYAGSYEIKADSIFLSFDKTFRNIKSLKAIMNNEKRILKGLTNDKQAFEIDLEKIRNEKLNYRDDRWNEDKRPS